MFKNIVNLFTFTPFILNLQAKLEDYIRKKKKERKRKTQYKSNFRKTLVTIKYYLLVC